MKPIHLASESEIASAGHADVAQEPDVESPA